MIPRPIIDEVAFHLSEAAYEGDTQAVERLASVASVIRSVADQATRETLAESMADFGLAVCLLELGGDHGRAIA